MSLDIPNKFEKIFVVSMIISLLPSQAAYADAGLPMLILVWPSSWILLLLIIPLEAFVALRILKTSYLEGLKLSSLANLVSTIAGIPITWIVLVIAQIVCGGSRAYGIETLTGKILAVTVQSPWLIPYENARNWMVPAAAISLCIAFFFMSVGIEYYVATKLYGRNVGNDKLSALLTWSWRANLLSYGLIIVFLLILLILGIIFPYHGH
jgi:hypothetical protein